MVPLTAKSSGITTRSSPSVVMPAGGRVFGELLRVGNFLFAIAARALGSVTTVTTVTTDVHPDESDEDENPEPVCGEPCHEPFLQWAGP